MNKSFCCPLLMSLTLVALCITSAAHAQEWPQHTSPTHVGGGERDAALIIGIEDYAFAPDVAGATLNAADWYTYLTRARGIPVKNTILLRDAQGTLESLRKQAALVASQVEEGGTLWVVFIGHGAPAPDGTDGLLVGVDAQQTADSLVARSLAQDELVDIVSAGAQANTVLVIDACFSGKVDSSNVLVPGLQPMIPVREAAQRATVLSAGTSDQFAGPLPGEQRPAFSYLALGALRGWGDSNTDGVVSAREVTDYARDALQTLALDRTQTPEVHGAQPDLPLTQSAGDAAPDLAAMVLAINPGGGGALGGGDTTGGVSTTTPRADDATDRVSINGGFSTAGFLLIQYGFSPSWAFVVGLGGWIVEGDPEVDSPAVTDVNSPSVEEMTYAWGWGGGLGFRWLWSRFSNTFFLGWHGNYFYAPSGSCELSIDNRCTDFGEDHHIQLTMNLGYRYGFDWGLNITARLGGGVSLGFGQGASAIPDAELSVGYDF